MAKKDLSEMNLEELQKELEKTKEAMEEIEQERDFLFYNTTKHIPGSTFKKYEAEIQRYQNLMQKIEQLIKEKE